MALPTRLPPYIRPFFPVDDAPLVPRESATEAARSMFEHARPDGISTDEYTSVVRHLNRWYGRADTNVALSAVFAEQRRYLAPETVAMLSESQTKQIGKALAVLADRTPGAMLLDTNLDGDIDPDDLLVNGDTVTRVNAVAAERARIGRALVNAAEAMGKAAHKFEILPQQRFSPAFWEPVQAGVTFRLRDGVKPADAVRDIFEHPRAYGFECATAMVIVYYKAMLEVVGDEAFNAMCPDIRMGPWKHDNDLADALTVTGRETEAPATFRDSLSVGDYAYIRNWDVSPAGSDAGWQGENVIYLGHGKYYGHPFGIESEEHIVRSLNDFRNTGSKHSASFTSLKIQFSPRLSQ